MSIKMTANEFREYIGRTICPHGVNLEGDRTWDSQEDWKHFCWECVREHEG